MKLKSIFFLLGTLFFVATQSPAQQKSDFTIDFITLGNCYVCKVRVESKLNALEGVSASNYDPATTVTTVTYDEFVTDAYIIMQAVADTGHDTEWFRAPDEAYNMLIGTCCEYERTIDYSEAEVGYLSLMGIWMGHVAVENIHYMDQVSVYPSINNGLFSVDLGEIPSVIVPQLRVYSLSGQLMLHENLIWSSKNQIDLTNQPNGSYLVCIGDQSQNISTTKIIKQ